MAAERYIKEVQHSPVHGQADVALDEGQFVGFGTGSNGEPLIKAADPSVGVEVEGIIPHRLRGPQLPEHEEDFSDVQYDAGAYDVPAYPLEDGAKLTRDATTVAEAVNAFQGVAFDANVEVVPAESADAVTSAVGSALHTARVGEGVAVRIGL